MIISRLRCTRAFLIANSKSPQRLALFRMFQSFYETSRAFVIGSEKTMNNMGGEGVVFCCHPPVICGRRLCTIAWNISMQALLWRRELLFNSPYADRGGPSVVFSVPYTVETVNPLLKHKEPLRTRVQVLRGPLGDKRGALYRLPKARSPGFSESFFYRIHAVRALEATCTSSPLALFVRLQTLLVTVVLVAFTRQVLFGHNILLITLSNPRQRT